MELLKLTSLNIERCVIRAAEVLRTGGVILYPTDTLYGLGADAFSDEAVRKVQKIKSRDLSKPIHCVVADLSMAQKYAALSADARLLAREFLPGPLTLVLKKRKGINRGIARKMKTIGIRIPDNVFCVMLARTFGRPYTTTSANISGEVSARRVPEIISQLGMNAAGIDLVIDAGKLPLRKPSTVVDVSGSTPVIMREGAIATGEIWQVLSEEI